MNKTELESGLREGYKARSIPLLEGIRIKALEQGHYEIAEKDVKCINALQNPFWFYC